MAFASVLFCSTAAADVVPFQWSTTGSFTSVTSQLSFDNVTNQTANVNTGTYTAINLGSFSLHDVWFSDTGSFNLTVDFTKPAGATDTGYPNTPVVVTASWLPFFGNDSATINFDNAVKTIAFNGGSFGFSVDDVILRSWGGPVQLTGRISDVQLTSAAVPEPGSIFLLCTAFGGLAFAARKRLFQS